jgi:addiction module HigA family antidote
MVPENRIPTHPGEILSEEFLKPLDISQVALAGHIGVPVQRINEIVRGKRGITPDTAWKLAQAFETSAGFWINLQANHDLAKNRPSAKVTSLLRNSRERKGGARSASVPSVLAVAARRS